MAGNHARKTWAVRRLPWNEWGILIKFQKYASIIYLLIKVKIICFSQKETRCFINR